MAALLPQALESSLIALGLASGIVAIAVLLRWYCLLCRDYRTPQEQGRQKISKPPRDNAKPTPTPAFTASDKGSDVVVADAQQTPTVLLEDPEAAVAAAAPPALKAIEESPPTPRTRITVVTTPPTAETDIEEHSSQVQSSLELGAANQNSPRGKKRHKPRDRRNQEARAHAAPGPLGGSTAAGIGSTNTNTAADAKMLAQWKQRAARSFNVAAGGRRPREEFDDEIDDTTDDGTSRLGIVPYGGGRGRTKRRPYHRRRHQRHPSTGSRSSDPDGFGTDGFGTDGEDGAGSGGSGAWSIHRRWLGWTASPASEAAIRPPRGSDGGEEGPGWRGRWGGGGGSLSFDSSAAASESSGATPAGVGVYGCRRLGIVPLWTTVCGGGHPQSLLAVAAALEPPPPLPFPLPEWTEESGAQPQH